MTLPARADRIVANEAGMGRHQSAEQRLDAVTLTIPSLALPRPAAITVGDRSGSASGLCLRPARDLDLKGTVLAMPAAS
jgi:hypothetical protein